MDDDELRDLQERVQLIEDMIATPGWALLLDSAAKQLDVRQQALLHGSPKDYTDYQKQVSFIDGASFIVNLPTALRASVEEEMTYRAAYEEAEEEAA